MTTLKIVAYEGQGQHLKPLLFYMSQFLHLTENECLNLLLYIRRNKKLYERRMLNGKSNHPEKHL